MSAERCHFQGLRILVLVSTAICVTNASNLTCYQCIRYSEEQCSPEDLKPCASKFDRCVTHVTKTAQRGFSIRRECGLAPCSFDDDMVNKGLGMGNCDRSKNEYFCLSCCKQSGCNKNNAKQVYISNAFMYIVAILFTKSLI